MKEKILTRRMLFALLMGFSAGLPLLLTKSTLKGWLTDSGLDLATIGFFSLAGMPYSLKFIWAPILDRWVPPFLGRWFGRRRSWIFIAQISVALALLLLSLSHPAQNLKWIAVLAVVIAFWSATQDIAIDALRIETLPPDEQGLGSGLYAQAYRIAMLVSGAGAFILADHVSWQQVYRWMAALMALMTLITWAAPRGPKHDSVPTSFKDAIWGPLRDYFQNPSAWLFLSFILLFKVGDNVAAAMLEPFYIKLGFTKTAIGAVSKVFGLWATIGGSALGGILVLKYGVRRTLVPFGILQALSTLGFAWLASVGPSKTVLAVVVTFENVSSGLGTAAFLAFMASLVNLKYTATQYALLSAVATIPRDLFGASSGVLAERLGWAGFFVFCAAAAAPGLILGHRLKRAAS